MSSSNETIDFIGELSSTRPHPRSLLAPAPFTTSSGQTKDPLLHIAVAQVLPDESGLHPEEGDVGQAGLDKLEQWASCAARKGADVVVFPEYFLSGATHDLWRRVREVQRREAGSAQQQQTAEGGKGKGSGSNEAEGNEKAWIEIIIHVAQKYDIDIVAGTVVELGTQPHANILADHPVSQSEPQDKSKFKDHDKIPHRKPKKHAPTQDDEHEDELFNTSYYISRHGQVLHRYTKQNLWHPERETLLHSQQHTHPEQHHGPSTFIIETKRGTRLRAAMAICWDLAWYERFYQMISPPYAKDQVSDLDAEDQAPGPDVIFAPTCWYASDGGAKALLWNGVGEALMLDTLCLSRAVELEVVLIMCNVSGPSMDDKVIEKLRESLRKQHEDGVADDELETPLIGLGRSRICAPFLNVVAEVPDEREVMLLQSIDLNVLRDAREMYRMRYDHLQR
ncbi:Carbon-nitrogen hydrolase [Kalmanozyma brasiliensis GHG001]|uniref:CN hydrolase domain-containing protein n=1 Tax=Kalmanozyma brasiliensis (strain GHG001) TaxID=1365824 RepID=V5EG07_KALBG|nr:Carbon-nitrogen hydrolase [Kalmanozyma brasiliensis GHG001]EST09486.1 Carbon-nitrogen hydrolase [Kalmanozyma brasiliensis GHG001]